MKMFLCIGSKNYSQSILGPDNITVLIGGSFQCVFHIAQTGHSLEIFFDRSIVASQWTQAVH